MKQTLAIIALLTIAGCSRAPTPEAKEKSVAPVVAAPKEPVLPTLSHEERKAFVKEATKELREHRDKMEGISFYMNKKRNLLAPRLEAYLSVPDTVRPLLRVSPVYYGDDWVFFGSIKVMADDVVVYEREMRDDDVVRDNSGGSVWETGDYVGRDLDIVALKKIANSKAATIRFEGRERRHDHEITKQELFNLRQILTTYDELASKLGS